MLLGFLLGWRAFQPQSGSVSKKALPVPAALTLNPHWELSLSKLCCPWNGLMCPVEFFGIKVEKSKVNLGNIYSWFEACFIVLVIKLRWWLLILHSHFSFSSQCGFIPDAASKHAKPSGAVYASVWWNLLQYSQEQHCTAGQHLQHLAVPVRPGPGPLASGQAPLHARWHHVAFIRVAAETGLRQAARTLQQHVQPQNYDEPVGACSADAFHPPLTLPRVALHVRGLLPDAILQHARCSFRGVFSHLQKRLELWETAEATVQQGQLNVTFKCQKVRWNKYETAWFFCLCAVDNCI